jgi:hypothetical protein
MPPSDPILLRLEGLDDSFLPSDHISWPPPERLLVREFDEHRYMVADASDPRADEDDADYIYERVSYSKMPEDEQVVLRGAEYKRVGSNRKIK